MNLARLCKMAVIAALLGSLVAPWCSLGRGDLNMLAQPRASLCSSAEAVFIPGQSLAQFWLFLSTGFGLQVFVLLLKSAS